MTTNNREHMLARAEGIVRESGARHLTLDGVAKASGMSKGGVLYHFPNKDELLKALLERALAREDGLIAERLEELGDAPQADLVARIEACELLLADDANLPRSILAAIAEDPSLVEPLRQRDRETRELVRERSPDPDLAELLLFASRGLFLHRVLGLSRGRDETHRRLTARLTRLAEAMHQSPCEGAE